MFPSWKLWRCPVRAGNCKGNLLRQMPPQLGGQSTVSRFRQIQLLPLRCVGKSLPIH